MHLTGRQLSQGILTLAAVLLIVHHFGFYYGHYGYDDMHYARLAAGLLDGHVDWADHYSYRWGVLLPTAVSYAIFGVNDWASALPSLSSSLFIAWFFYQSFRHYPAIFLLVIATYLCSGWPLFYSDKIMPDIHVAAFGLLAWRSYDRYRLGSWRWSSILFSIALFAAFCTKGTVILLLPVFIFCFVYHRGWLSERRLYWGRVIGLLGLLMGTYLMWSHTVTGSAWSRLDAIEAGSYINSCSYDIMPWSVTIQRVTTDFLIFAWQQLFWIPLVVGLGVFFVLKKRRKSIDWYYPLVILICLLSADLMTISLDSYSPTCLDPRHFLVFWPIWAMCAGRMILQIGWITPDMRWIMVIASVLLLIKPIHQMVSNRNTEYPALRSEIQAPLVDPDLDLYHLTGNDVMNNLLDYYSGYQRDSKPKTDTLYLTSWYTDWHDDKAKVLKEPLIEIPMDNYEKLKFYKKSRD